MSSSGPRAKIASQVSWHQFLEKLDVWLDPWKFDEL